MAIDFGRDGALWVAEMHDYPDGIKPSESKDSEEGAAAEIIPGGRIRLVRDSDGDGQFDHSTIFLDYIPLPTGVTVWRKGVLVCAAPDILYAEDTDGDDKADLVRKLFSGFGTSNNQARLNSLVYGLDDWIYGSCGLFGGTITNFKGVKYELGDRDFRIKPDSGEIEAATGRTQQGRVRDGFGNWFGCDNTNLGYHYPLSEHYLKRNPFVGSPPSRVNLAQSAEARTLFPARGDAQRFQLSGPPGTVTAACGIGVYRDAVLGPDYQNNLFVCEPVNLLVHRMILKPNGCSYEAERAGNEKGTEFLRSTDGWFRPVQAITGPDGGLWVVDMYRFIIEDPRWIPEQELAPLDVRAGSMLGRIYRVINPDADRSSPATRFAVSDRGPTSPNPKLHQRSVFQELELQRTAGSEGVAPESISRDVSDSWRAASVTAEPALRIMSFRQLAVRGLLDSQDLRNALADVDPRVRAFGITLAERSTSKALFLDAILRAASDQDPRVRLQAAQSLGEWDDGTIGSTLAQLALRDARDPYIVAAVFSSMNKSNLQAFTTTLFQELAGKEPPPSLMAPFLATAVGLGDDAAMKLALVAVAQHGETWPKAWQLKAMTDLVESLSLRSKAQPADAGVRAAVEQMQDEASVMALMETLDDAVRVAAIQLLGRDPVRRTDDMERLSRLLSPSHPPNVQLASVEAFERIASDDVPGILASHYREVSPVVQPRIVDTILSRDAWFPLLFDEIARGTIPASSITAAQRQELVGHPIAAIRDRASQLLASTFKSDRQQVVQQYRTAIGMSGDSDRGKVLFAKTCATCHKLGDVGHAVGPNLAMVANKTPSFMLQEIFDPNRNVDTRYVSYVAVTKAGLIRTGVLSNESSSSVTLLAAEGKPFTLLRSELEELRATGKSLMPEGLEKELSPQAAADLISFLSNVPVPSKQLEGNSPAIIKPVSGRLALVASRASIFGDQITFEVPFGNVGYWHGLQDHVVWSVEVPEAAEYDVYLDGACDAGAAGNLFRLEVGDKSLSGQIESTGGWDKYVRSKLGTISLSAGINRVVLRPDGVAIRGALVDLKCLHFVPAGDVLALADGKPLLAGAEIDEIARRILDDNLKEDQREALIAQHPDEAASLVVAMTQEMPQESKEEYRRIPWIWRVAVACGKRDREDQIVKMLEVSLPSQDQPLRDWQAVVIGGGVINGIGLKGEWPKSRIDGILRGKPDLSKRWKRSLQLAAVMAEDEKTFTGTRYDALRMIALDSDQTPWTALKKYLRKGIDDELQMGAISGLSDIESIDISRDILENVGHFNEENRVLALDALLRTNARIKALLDALENQQILVTQLSPTQRKSLRESKDPFIRDQAVRILGE